MPPLSPIATPDKPATLKTSKKRIDKEVGRILSQGKPAATKQAAPLKREERGTVTIEEFLYPHFNTLKLDGKTLDGRPYEEGVNLLGHRKPQYNWDQDNDHNYEEPVFWIEPGARLVVGKQEQFYRAIFQWPEVFLGGAAGGSKSVALIKSHVVKHLSWKARGITGQITAMFCETKEELLRRHIVNLPKHVPKWLGWWDAENFIFHFYPKFGGGVIMFLYVGRKKTDVERLLSYEFAYVTIDELTRNQRYVYDFITSRLRSTMVPAAEWCVASASNPGSVGHKWVYHHFVNSRERQQAAIRGERRCFIQALANENPYLPEEYYEKILGKLPPKLRQAYRDGNWLVFEGQFFDMLDETVHFIPRFRVPDEVAKYFGIDFGTNHPTGCVWLLHYPSSKDYPNGRIIVYRYYEGKDKWPNRHKKQIWERMKNDKNVMRPSVLSHDAFAARGSTEGNLTVGERFNADDEWGPGFDCIPSNRDRKARWRALLDMLSFESHYEVGSDGKVTERVIDRPPQLQFMDTPETRMLFEELAALIHKEGDSEDVEKLSGSEYEVGMGDEGPDALGTTILAMGAGVLFQDYSEPQEKYDPYRERRRDRSTSVGYGSFVM